MVLLLITIALTLLGPYLYRKLRYKRLKQYAVFPQMPASLILGHLKIMDDFIRAGEPNEHPGHNISSFGI